MNFRIISVSSSDEQFQNYQEDQNPVSSSYVTRQWCSFPISFSEILLGGHALLVHELKFMLFILMFSTGRFPPFTIKVIHLVNFICTVNLSS